MDYNNKEDELFQKWASFLGVTMDEFVSDGLLFHAGLKFDGLNYVRTTSGDNSFNWDSSKRRLLIITRDQPSATHIFRKKKMCASNRVNAKN